jgi:hypothetical protein
MNEAQEIDYVYQGAGVMTFSLHQCETQRLSRIRR